jgi:hypothetical protein
MEKFEEIVDQSNPVLQVVDLGRIRRFRLGMAWMELARRNPAPPNGEEHDHEP